MVSMFDPAAKEWYHLQIQESQRREQVLKEMNSGDEEWKRAVRQL